MQLATKNVMKFYGAWVFLWTTVAFLGNIFSPHGECGISAHLVLSFTGLPLALLSFHSANGTTMGTVLAGTIGFIQWVMVAELNGKLRAWWKKRRLNA